jgi:hypothetical protein
MSYSYQAGPQTYAESPFPIHCDTLPRIYRAECKRKQALERARLIAEHEEEMRQQEQYRANQEAYNKKGCFGKACTNIKRFFTGKNKLVRGGKRNRTRKSQRK